MSETKPDYAELQVDIFRQKLSLCSYEVSSECLLRINDALTTAAEDAKKLAERDEECLALSRSLTLADEALAEQEAKLAEAERKLDMVREWRRCFPELVGIGTLDGILGPKEK